MNAPDLSKVAIANTSHKEMVQQYSSVLSLTKEYCTFCMQEEEAAKSDVASERKCEKYGQDEQEA